MFYQCGILQDCDVLAIHGYEQFIKTLHHHMVMGNVTISQLGQFLILMTYMSFCRMNHYTNYMKEEDAINLEVAVWMSIVIMAFRTSFHAEGSHRTINPYFKVLNTIIRRKLHVIITRYLEQEFVKIMSKVICFQTLSHQKSSFLATSIFCNISKKRDFPDSVLPMNMKPCPNMAKLLQ